MNDFSRHDANEQQIRELLDDAVADVEPRDGLESIRSRTSVTPMRARRPLIWGASAAVLATAATVVAVTALSGGLGTAPNANNGVAGTPSVTETVHASAAVPVYFVGGTSHGPRLFREFHKSNGHPPVAQAVTAAVEYEPGAPGAEDPDYRTGWPAGTRVAASFTGNGNAGQITIDLRTEDGASLHDRPVGMSRAAARLALQQLVYTAQAATKTTAPVQFLLDGHHTDRVLGQPTSEPIARASTDTVLAQVWIIAPYNGQHLTSPFTVRGLANAFEANVQWELKQGSAVVRHGFTTATECCTMAPYSFPVKAPPGVYTLVVHDSDPSDGEGFGPWRDTKNITIVP